jgi:phosphate transport system protein
MPKRFDEDLYKLKQDVLAMGTVAEGMIRKAMGVLVDRNPALIAQVLADEDKMDAFQRSIDNETVRLIGVFTPVARDLRFLLMITRINAELERIGDHAVAICQSYENLKLLEEPPLKPLVDLPRMAGIAEQMLHRALEAFLKGSEGDAEVVIQTDDQVDRLNDQIFRELVTYMLGDPRTINRVLGLILTARAFERVADHAVNIAEDVVYIVRGEDIRHVKS